MHWPGVEPGSAAWKAAMLTVTPPMPTQLIEHTKNNTLTIQGILVGLERGVCPR